MNTTLKERCRGTQTNMRRWSTWKTLFVGVSIVAVVSCGETRHVVADASPAMAEPDLVLPNDDDKIRRLRIAGWTFVGIGVLTPAIVWSTVTKKDRGDDDSVVGIARGTSFLLGSLVAGAIGGGMLGRARRLDKKSDHASRVSVGIGWGTVTVSGDF